jgi:hypothetical protein
MKKCITALLSIGLLPIVSVQALQWDTENFVDSDTLLLYRFNETSGTTIFDSSGNGFHGTLASADARAGAAPTWLTTPSGDYLAPVGGNGMNANVTVTGVNFNTGLTISFWYRAEVDQVQGGELFQMEGPRTRINTDDFGTGSGGRLRLTGNFTQGDLVNFGTEGVWRHIGVVYDPLDGNASNGGEWRMYLNNALVSTVIDSGDLGSDTSFTLRVANNTFNNGALTGGNIDEFFISNRLITDFSTAAIPEPGTLALVAIAGLSMLLTFRRKRR